MAVETGTKAIPKECLLTQEEKDVLEKVALAYAKDLYSRVLLDPPDNENLKVLARAIYKLDSFYVPDES